ncbi:hypothetical protein ACFWIZ_09265, partial [Streptomyces sp. NPDC127044]
LAWSRDIAGEYIADTVIAVRGQWAGHNRNRTGWGEPLSASGKAGRVDTIRSFFCDLIEWEWITPGSIPAASWLCRCRSGPVATRTPGSSTMPPGPSSWPPD